MKSKHLLLLGAALCCLFTAVNPAFAQSNAFTYQGRLSDGGAPVKGATDFTFTLYNADSGGGAVGVSNVVHDLLISNGLFTASLDFGAVFDGSSRWIEIAVRPGASTGGFSVLNPRQPLTATPYALYALTPAGPPGTQGLKGDKGDVGAA
jgi:hypothetical protein